MTAYSFIEPLDVLFLRGNKLFGDPGSFGESQVLPWPSVAAGAIRSLLLTQAGIDPALFARGEVVHPTLGTPARPGSFTLAAFHLARRVGRRIETLHAPPADLVINHEAGLPPQASRMTPTEPAPGLASSASLPHWPVLGHGERKKPTAGWWLTQAGWAAYLAGRLPAAEQLVATPTLWKLDARVGVGLSPQTRRADDGKLFSMQAVAFEPGVGFLAGIQGAENPAAGVLRLGGDGRGAAIAPADAVPAKSDYAGLAAARRCRVVLTTPGLFPGGWLPTGTGADHRFELHGVRARVVCAAMPRAGVVSGFDLAQREPKPAQRVAAAGSVYWLDEIEATPEQLRKLAETGLWADPAENAARRAEGFNRCVLAAC